MAAAVPYRFADRAFAFNASVSRFRGGALVTSDSRRWCATWATSSTARLNASSFARDGFVNPESLRTNWSDDARISSFVAGGEKLCRVLMARHMKPINRRPASAQGYGVASSGHYNRRLRRSETIRTTSRLLLVVNNDIRT